MISEGAVGSREGSPSQDSDSEPKKKKSKKVCYRVVVNIVACMMPYILPLQVKVSVQGRKGKTITSLLQKWSGLHQNN